MPAGLSVFWMWMLCLKLRVGPSLSCTPSVRIKDLHCHLHWNCTDYSSSTTFIVQTKQLGNKWQNVSDCFQTSSRSCDLSQAFSDIDEYNFVRLIINDEHKRIDENKTQTCRFLHNPDARFSAPSVSVSQEGPKMLVDLSFPCAPSAFCQDDEVILNCCSLSRFFSLNTTVTVYNPHNTSDTQTRTKVFVSEPSRVEFGWLGVGQEYCVVAQFASSPLSEPQCVHISPQGSLTIAALCGVMVAFLLIGVCLLVRRWTSSETRLPKSLMSLQNEDLDSPFVAESGLTTLEEEENSVVLSIMPLHNSTYIVSESKTQSACLCSKSHEDGYYASSILQHQTFDYQIGDAQSQVETDGDASTDHYPGHLYPSDPAGKTGHACLLEDCITLGNLGVPLSSVKVAGGQREEMERDHLHEVLLNLKIVNESHLVSDGDGE